MRLLSEIPRDNQAKRIIDLSYKTRFVPQKKSFYYRTFIVFNM